jgi:hypothetical protein
MEPVVVDTYAALVQRFASGFLIHVVTKHQGAIVNPVNQVPATLWALVLVIGENYIERQIRQIRQPRLALLRDVMSTIFVFIGSFLAYLLIALIDGFFEDELGTELSIVTIYRMTILIVTISLIITLLKFLAGELKTEDPKPKKQNKSQQQD